MSRICAGMCAARGDRAAEAMPYQQAEIDRQTARFDDAVQYVPNAPAVGIDKSLKRG
ncbi:hypothetical protein [Mycolicibacterium smegmatis]|uniref:Uncharacterized protein n=1 Tax=Mycolicibacterium smegmatis (strain MKD8) TaxID=1214915 RepID=A0A2U9PNC6_MYCSE|nr:hypothetical protein D806_022070 [Mycolicibacterium smegmatis MKD8]